MVLLGCYCGVAIVLVTSVSTMLQWCCYVLLWHCYGVVWCCCGVAMVLLWCCYGVAMVLLQDEVGWSSRGESRARRLIVAITDGDYHFALDGKVRCRVDCTGSSCTHLLVCMCVSLSFLLCTISPLHTTVFSHSFYPSPFFFFPPFASFPLPFPFFPPTSPAFSPFLVRPSSPHLPFLFQLSAPSSPLPSLLLFLPLH